MNFSTPHNSQAPNLQQVRCSGFFFQDFKPIYLERRSVKIIQQTTTSSHNPHLLSEQEEKKVIQKQQANKQRLRVPRRPPWTKSMTAQELDRQEKASFLDWRRGLAELVSR